MSLNKALQQRLLDLAKRSIQHGLKTGSPLKINLAEYPEELTEKRATFVTLQKNHQLRGCIGMLEAVRPLAEDIAENAYAAAFNDPRFPPLQAYELDDLEIHLSLLTPAEPVSFTSEQDLISQLQPGIDGLILEEPEIYGVANQREQTTTENRRFNIGKRSQTRNLSAFGMGAIAGTGTIPAASETKSRIAARLLVKKYQDLSLSHRSDRLIRRAEIVCGIPNPHLDGRF